MNLDILIKSLNEKDYTLNTTFEALNADEKLFIETYQPHNVFIVYGTLAPNRPNHHIIEHIKGEWKDGIVKGKLEAKGWGADLGYYGFKHAIKEEEQSIQAFILFSENLPNNWLMLDEFEGIGYKRVLARFELNDGKIGVGNIYALNESD